jgi:phosphoserine aminotransferase
MTKIRHLEKRFLSKHFEGFSLSSFQKNEKVINFSPGPSQIPRQVMNEIIQELKFCKYGITPLEISHRSPEFTTLLDRVNSNLRYLMKIPDDFSIIWTQGGGHGQFSAVPLNLSSLFKENISKANYVVTGTWSERAFQESNKFVHSYNSYDSTFHDNINNNKISNEQIKVSEEDVYLFLCSNETVNGLEFRRDGITYPCRQILKDTYSVIDMSSDFTMKNLPWQNIDVAFACSSKNLGTAGANVTVIRNDLLELLSDDNIPGILNWKSYTRNNSLYNTPAIHNIFIIDKVIEYYLKKGDVDVLEFESREKSNVIYNYLNKSILYNPQVNDVVSRSNINIPFTVGNGCEQLRSQFLHHCFLNNVVGLRTRTPFQNKMKEPLRISLYNGISLEDTEYLIEIMKDFEYSL